PPPPLLIKPPPPSSTLLASSAASDVYKRQDRFGRFASGLLLLFAGFGACDSRIHSGFTRVAAV
ncbi:hypothetical protein QLF87_22350, partial [Salmonella enterica subsp. enterica serovar Oslo]|nr:hypothetical protein [Salmonella enterica subsp. enterica serovar Oslo]